MHRRRYLRICGVMGITRQFSLIYKGWCVLGICGHNPAGQYIPGFGFPVYESESDQEKGSGNCR